MKPRDMTYNHLILLFRILKKRWILTSLIILGFATGLAICLVLGQKISYELSYDKFNENHQNIYRVALDHYYPHDQYQNSTALSFHSIGPELVARYPEVEKMVRVFGQNNENITVLVQGEKHLLNKDIFMVDSTFFQIFTTKIKYGLTENLQFKDIFISESFSNRIFGQEDPVGETLQMMETTWKIKGVFKDVGSNSHFKYNLLVVAPNQANARPNWSTYNDYTYLLLNENADIDALEKKLEDFSTELSKVSDESSQVEYRWETHLQPLTSIHLSSDLEFEHEANGSVRDIQILIAIIGMLALISCFNFANLQKIIFEDRIKETKIRKVFGASSNQIFSENILQYAVLILAGILLAGILVKIALMFEVSDFGIEFYEGRNYYILGSILLVFVMISFLFTFFTMVKVSSLQLINHGNSRATLGLKNRSFLTITQFVISVILIIMAISVNKQLTYLNEIDLGFSNDRVLTISTRLPYVHFKNELKTIETTLLQNSYVKSVSLSETIPGEQYTLDGSFRLAEQPEEEAEFIYLQVVSTSYFETYEINILAGRSFTNQSTRDSTSVIINESLAKLFNLPYEELVGRRGKMPWGNGYQTFEIVGVVEDYYHQSLRSNIEPCAYINLENGGPVNNISVRYGEIDDEKEQQIVKLVEETFSSAFPNYFTNLTFSKSIYENQFIEDLRLSKVVTVVTLISLFMSILGFIGLASNYTQKRTKEVAIRKVNGAKNADIFILFGISYLKLVVITFILAIPISIYMVKLWLEDFVIRIDLGLWFVLWPVVIIVGVSLSSISYYVMKIAILDPVKILREN